MDEINVHSSRNANPSTFKDAEESYCLSWCPSRYQFPMIVVGCGKENSAKVSNYLLNHLRVYRKHVYNFFYFFLRYSVVIKIVNGVHVRYWMDIKI